jgi:hypothetical protein
MFIAFRLLVVNTMFTSKVIIKYPSYHILFTEHKIEKGKRKKLEDKMYYHLQAGLASAGQHILEHSDATRVL